MHRRRGQREDPGDDDVAGHAPAHGRHALGRARPHHGAGDRVGGGEREADVRGREDHRRAGALGREALGRVHLDDAAAHRPDDPPAARRRCRARSRSRPTTTTQFGVVGVARGRCAVGDQRERDDAHRLLRVVGAVGEREQAARDHLPAAEAAGHRPRPQAPDDPVEHEDREPATTNASVGATSAGTTTLPRRPSSTMTALGPLRHERGARPRRRSARATSSTAARSTR